MATFKEQVEEIQETCLADNDNHSDCEKYRHDCSKCRTDRILAANNAELDRIADKERVCKKCLKPYNAPSLCPICEKLLTNNIS